MDSRRCRTRVHHSTLVDIFANGWLLQPGLLKVLKTPIGMARINCDKLIIAGFIDHITPWKGVLILAALPAVKRRLVVPRI